MADTSVVYLPSDGGLPVLTLDADPKSEIAGTASTEEE